MTSGHRVGNPGTGARPDQIRRSNRTAVVRSLHLSGAHTRTELADSLQLNRSTIKSVVDGLVLDGIAVQHSTPSTSPSTAASGPGRPSTVVDPVPTSAWVVAVDAAIDWPTVAAIGLGGSRIADHRLDSIPEDINPAALVVRISEAVDELRSRISTPPLAMGIAVPGLVRARDNLVRSAPNLGWVDVPLGEMLQQRNGIETWVANESDLGALAEHVRGCARDVEDLVYLMADVGVGGGVVTAGVGLTGAGGYAGEIGHMCVTRTGTRCNCGALGCWETVVGQAALKHAVAVPSTADLAELCTRLDDIHSGAEAMPDGLEEYAQWLGMGVANLVTVFDPSTVVFGGLFADVLPLIADTVQRIVDSSSLVAQQHGSIDFRYADLGSQAPLVGAAELAFSDVLPRL